LTQTGETTTIPVPEQIIVKEKLPSLLQALEELPSVVPGEEEPDIKFEKPPLYNLCEDEAPFQEKWLAFERLRERPPTGDVKRFCGTRTVDVFHRSTHGVYLKNCADCSVHYEFLWLEEFKTDTDLHGVTVKPHGPGRIKVDECGNKLFGFVGDATGKAIVESFDVRGLVSSLVIKDDKIAVLGPMGI
jgi:hypothetical protein